MESGDIVEYIDSQKIICAVILEINKLRLKLLTENNREVKLSAGRLSHKGKNRLNLSLSRSRLVEDLKRIASHRKSLSERIDLKELWDTVHTEQEWISLETMTGLCFPDAPDCNHESAVARAIFGNRLFFKFKSDRFFPNSEHKVDQLICAEKEARQQKLLLEKGASWIKKTLRNPVSDLPEQFPNVVKILKSYFLYDKESPFYASARAMLKKAEVSSPNAIFAIMEKHGIWKPDENIEILRYGIQTDFTKAVMEKSNGFSPYKISQAPSENRRDLTDLEVITIDGQYTLDFDDALSIEKKEDHYLVGIHIADVAHYIKKGDCVDREVMSRASSIYMPDRKVSMAPPALAEDLCSLKENEIRPAITTMVKINKMARVMDYEIFPSLIKVNKQLSYYDANLLAKDDENISLLYKIARGFRDKRTRNGAVHIILPEINIWLDQSGLPVVSMVNRESPGRVLVSELMILSNWLTARFLTDHQVPAVFRSQAAPRERILKGDGGSLFQNLLQRKMLSRFMLGIKPENHSGLGLEAYVTATSPIRKYIDLVTQRQVRSVLCMEVPYTEKEIKAIIRDLSTPMGNVARIQRSRNRYWLLKYLEGKIGTKEEAIVVRKVRNAYIIVIKEYMLECTLSQSSGIALKPEDLVTVVIQHVNARTDTLSVFMG